ncbi:hypothetical protein PoB_006226200 [Plakobranchus ocellatus]|uniref:Uncharacterized protein n=1 Tax=Plakobranchus ocellatus TaxID=259542 RepID=A0AAV4CV21_9GAST|nr:hypothetical protein PoB_006226200 [Plakobranchus ocellatus]
MMSDKANKPLSELHKSHFLVFMLRCTETWPETPQSPTDTLALFPLPWDFTLVNLPRTASPRRGVPLHRAIASSYN